MSKSKPGAQRGADPLFADQARQSLVHGVDQVARLVRLTLGPTGQNVAVGKRSASVFSVSVVSQGKSVLEDLELADPFANIGAQLIRQMAQHTDDLVGDATSTAVVLAHAMLCEGYKCVAAGANAMMLKRGMDRAARAAAEHILTVARPLHAGAEMRQVMASACDNDEVAEALTWAVEQVGPDGLMQVERYPKTLGIIIEHIDGFRYDRGYLSAFFATGGRDDVVELEEPYVLLTDAEIASPADLMPLYEKLIPLSQHNLFIAAPEIKEPALGFLLANHHRGTVRCVAVRPPEYGDLRVEMLQDMAIFTGGLVLSRASGLRLRDAHPRDLGRADMVRVTANDTTLAGGHGDEFAIERRIAELRERLAITTDHYQRQKLEQRIAQLAGSMARIRVGGASEAEMNNLMERVENALTSLRAAVAEGIVPGGGTALLSAAGSLDTLRAEGDEAFGVAIVQRALEEPFRQIVRNAGQHDPAVLATVRRLQCERGDPFLGYDVLTNEYCNLLERGIVDPCKTVRIALLNAASCASMLLSTEALVLDSHTGRVPPQVP